MDRGGRDVAKVAPSLLLQLLSCDGDCLSDERFSLESASSALLQCAIADLSRCIDLGLALRPRCTSARAPRNLRKAEHDQALV